MVYGVTICLFSCRNLDDIDIYKATKFLYKPKDFHTKMMEEKEILDISMKESIRQKEERTTSEKMQEELEPIDSK